jgi:hypothetical protein
MESLALNQEWGFFYVLRSVKKLIIGVVQELLDKFLHNPNNKQ